ncbi:hypothetical protein [Sphingobium indicum]
MATAMLLSAAACNSPATSNTALPELKAVDPGPTDDRTSSLQVTTSLADAVKTCGIDNRLYNRMTPGIDGTLRYAPLLGLSAEQKKEVRLQVACLQQWDRLTNYHARVIFLETEQ